MDEIAGIRRAVKDSDFSPRYKAVLLTLIEEVVTIKKTKQEKEAQLKRIRRMLGNSSEKRPQPEEQSETTKTDSPKPAKNHGRYGAKDYRFTQTFSHAHQTLKAGQTCPECAHGTLQEIEPRKCIRLTGNAPIEAELHQPARLRCSGCEGIFHAELPPDVAEEKADASANAVVAVFRYGMGLGNKSC